MLISAGPRVCSILHTGIHCIGPFSDEMIQGFSVVSEAVLMMFFVGLPLLFVHKLTCFFVYMLFSAVRGLAAIMPRPSCFHGRFRILTRFRPYKWARLATTLRPQLLSTQRSPRSLSRLADGAKRMESPFYHHTNVEGVTVVKVHMPMVTWGTESCSSGSCLGLWWPQLI